MSSLTSALRMTSPRHVGAHHMAELPALQNGDPPAYPSFLGIAIGLYLVGVVVFSQREYLSYFVQAMAVLISVCWFAWSLATARRLLLPRPVIWFGVWMLWASITMPMSREAEPFNEVWMRLVKVCLMTFIASQCVRSRGDLLFCFISLVVASGIVFVVDAETVLQAVRYEKYQDIALSRANDTLLANSNTLAFFALFVLVGAVCCLLAYQSKLLKILAVVCVPFSLYLLAASGSRKGMAGIVLVAAGLFWFHFRKSSPTMLKRVIMIALGGGLVAGAVVFVTRLPTIERLQSTVGESGAFEQESRYVWFKRGLEIAVENPIMGIGIDGFSQSGASGRYGTYSHSTVTEVLAGTGVPGFCIYFASQVSLYLLLRRLRRLPLPWRDMAVVNCLMALLFVWYLYEVFAVMMDSKLGWPLLGAIAGYGLHLKNEYATGGPPMPAFAGSRGIVE